MGRDLPRLRIVGHEQLKRRVFRLRVENNGTVRSLIVKRVEPATARRSRLAVERWLPALGLEGVAPRLLGAAPDRTGSYVWQVQEDLGDFKLDEDHPDRERIEAAVTLIASLHTRGADHPLLAECRRHGEDFGAVYFVSNIRDARRCLDALRPPRVNLAAEDAARRDRLLALLQGLHDEIPSRSQALDALGGPETLLHGDLWTTNTFVVPTPNGLRARLIDWDHVGVGPVSYDLSTFLYRFSAGERPWILKRYGEELERAGWRLPSDTSDLNILFDTAERARYAGRLIWPAAALVRGSAEWALAELAEVERWFDNLRPLLPA